MRKKVFMLMLSVVLVAMLALQVSANNEKDSGPFGAIWEAIRNLQRQINEIITMEAPIQLVSDGNEPTISAINCGNGSAGHFGGDVEVTGDLILDGKLVVDSIDVSQITGLLGDGYTLKFPDVLKNMAILHSNYANIQNKAVIIQGPGYDIERIEGYGHFGRHNDQPGLSMEYPFVFECGGQDAEQLRNIVDQYILDPPSIQPIDFYIEINMLNGSNFMNIACEWFLPEKYEEGNDGRTRFTFIHINGPDNYPAYHINGPIPNELAINPETDTFVRVDGYPHSYPVVEIDETNRKVTFTFDHNEGGFAVPWAISTVHGNIQKRNLSIIEEAEPGIPDSEILAERQYYGCFPIRFEILEGFGLSSKLKTQVVLSYDWYEEIH